MHRTTRLTAVAVAAVATLATTGATATASTPEAAARVTLARGLVSPLTTAIAPDGTAYITENFAGMLVKKSPGKRLQTVYRARAKGAEVGGASLRNGVVTFTVTGQKTTLNRMARSGRVRQVANLGAYEAHRNPDGGVVYGFRDISDACAAQVPEEFGPAKYTGIVDSHPYATTRVGRATYVAEAAGNAILKVAHGRVSTLALLPPVAQTISAEAAQAIGMPDCVAGLDYWFEPVPTDVEQGPHGRLYVSTLTGGPEDGSLGALSRVYTVNRRTGAVHRVADGLAGATGVAVAPNGDVYVAELYGGRIARIAAGSSHPTLVRSVAQPAAVEYAGQRLYATTDVLSDPPAGRLIRFRP